MMITNLINLTPHDINLVDAENRPLVTINPSGQIARVTQTTVITGYITVKSGDDLVKIPTTKSVFGEVYDLPDSKPNTLYLVSQVVAKAAASRTDLRIPNESVRNDKGQIVGCLSIGEI